MTLQRVWLIENNSGKFISGYQYDAGSFGLVPTEDPDQAISLVTDHTRQEEFQVRLFQALTRHPATDSDIISFMDTVAAFELVRRACTLVSKDVDEDAQSLPNTTQLVGNAHYEIDAFGADQQLDKYDNRCVDLHDDIAQREFRLLDARLCVDAGTGQWYPGITVAAGPEPFFWVLPDDYLGWVDEMQTRGDFPVDVLFTENEEGRPVARIFAVRSRK
ncbi:hypothetical protein [Lacticaseibacillus sp. GG6-2]